jgi:hypothetical protein
VMTPVAGFVAVTVTPGMTAPLASAMIPLKLALLDWLNACVESANDRSNAITQQYRFMVVSSSPQNRVARMT